MRYLYIIVSFQWVQALWNSVILLITAINKSRPKNFWDKTNQLVFLRSHSLRIMLCFIFEIQSVNLLHLNILSQPDCLHLLQKVKRWQQQVSQTKPVSSTWQGKLVFMTPPTLACDHPQEAWNDFVARRGQRATQKQTISSPIIWRNTSGLICGNNTSALQFSPPRKRI